MTISPFIIYLFGIADKVQYCLTMLTAFAGVGAFTLILVGIVDRKDAVLKIGRRLLFIAVALLFLAIATPSSKTIAATVVVPAIVNSGVVQRDVPELYEAAISALKEQLGAKK